MFINTSKYLTHASYLYNLVSYSVNTLSYSYSIVSYSTVGHATQTVENIILVLLGCNISSNEPYTTDAIKNI
jgi:hypothetical protein